MNVFISTVWLGEKFVPKYDISAMILVFTGTLVIILLSNKEQQTYTVDRILSLMSSFGSIMYFATTIAFMISIRLFMPTMLAKLKKFERDCE